MTNLKAKSASAIDAPSTIGKADSTSFKQNYSIDAQASRLFEHLQRGGAWAYWWTDAGKRSFWYPVGKPTPLPKGKINLYFGVHPTTNKRKANERSRIEDITAINCLFAEFDAKDFSGDKAQARDHIQRLPLAPSVIVDSGGGYHCYWLLRETFIIASSADRKRARELQAQWVKFTGGDKASKDLARVLRLPGTRNYKPHYAPNFPEVKIIASDFARLYALDELDRVMQPASAAQPLPKRNESQRKTKYAQAALSNELRLLQSASNGTRNDQLNRSAFALGQLIGAGLLDRFDVESDLTRVALELGLTEAETRATIKSGIEAGMSEPRAIRDKATPGKQGPTQHAGQNDPLMALIESAAQSEDRKSALRSVFTQLAQRDVIDILTKYKTRVLDSFDLTAKDFEAILSSYRKVGGSLAEVIDGQLCWSRDPLCSYSARITHELSQQDGQNAARVFYAVEGTLANGEPLRPLTIPADDFENLKWVNQWGARASWKIRPRDRWLFIRALQELSQPKRETVYTFTGWNGKSFLTASGAITPEGLDPSVRVDLGEGQIQKYSLPEPPADPREAVIASLAFFDLAPFAVTAPLWAAMYAAPLTSRYPLNAVMWIYGKTQSLKSTMAALALTHFGKEFINGRNPKPPKDWESTYTDLEGAMFATKDLPLVIDDYTPQQTRGESEGQSKKAQRVIKSVGNRSYRGRSNIEMRERPPRPPRGLVISTAEEPITGQAVNGRMIYIPVGANDVTLGAALDRAQRLAGGEVYAQAMAAYLQWLARDENNRLTHAITGDHEMAIREGNAKLPNMQSRLVSYYAVLFTGARNGLRFALECKAINKMRFDELTDQIAAALLDLLITQGERVASQSPIIRLCEALADVITQGDAKLLKRLDRKSNVPERVTLLGWYENDAPVIYLRTNSCLQVARDYYNRLGQNFDVSPESFRRDVANSGLLARRDDRQAECVEYMGTDYGTTRVLVLDANKLKELAGVNLYPEGAKEEKC